MRLDDLMLIPRGDGGPIPMETLRDLAIPMDDDVLEQFPSDHGQNLFFQERYGSLDIHAVRWDQKRLKAKSIITCSVLDDFQDCVDNNSEIAKKVGNGNWRELGLRNEDVRCWANYGTWQRSPLLIAGALVASAAKYHLIEGHTRVGTLKGLVEGGTLDPDEEHLIWVGRRVASTDAGDEWKQAMRKIRLPFTVCLRERAIYYGDVDPIVDALKGAVLGGDTPEAVRAWAESQDAMKPHMELLDKYQKWWNRAS